MPLRTKGLSDAAKNEGTVGDADRAAVLARFTVMRDVVETFAPRLQIIVSDHADLVDEGWFQNAVEHRWPAPPSSTDGS